AEKILRRESPFLLIFGVFGMALSGFYFLFICSVTLAFYILIRAGQMDGPYWKRMILEACRAMLAYLTGLMMAGILFLPSVLGFLNSNRTASTQKVGLAQMLFVGPGGLAQWAEGLMSPTQDWFIGGMALLCLALVLGAGKELTGRGALLAGFGVSAVFVVCPLAQAALVGFGDSEYTRFWFAISFLLAYGVAVCWPRLFDVTRRQWAAAGVVFVLLAAGAALRGAGAVVWANLAFFAVMAALLWAGQKNGGARRAAAGLLACLTVAQLGLSFYADAKENVMDYRPGRFAWMMPYTKDKWQWQLENAWRVDVGDVALHRWWAGSNVAIEGGYKGLSEYFSILRKEYANAMLNDWALAPAQQGSFSFQSLDGCAALNTLAAVRYGVIREGEEAYLPYEYRLVDSKEQGEWMTVEPENGTTLYWYENQYQLPMGYAYDRYITNEEYQSLNALQRQAAMMHVLVTDAPAPGTTHASLQEDCGQQAVTRLERSEAVLSENAAWEEGLMRETTGTEKATLTFEVDAPANSEIHLCLSGLEQLNKEQEWISFEMEGGIKKEVFLCTFLNEESWVNLGYTAEGGKKTVTVTLCNGANFRLDEMELWAYDMEDYAAAAQERQQAGLKNVNTKVVNSLEALLESETDTALCLAVPYSEGWRATIDGQPAEIHLANSMFMQVDMPAGSHAVRIYYVTPGLKAGALLTAAGGLALLAQGALWLRGRRKNAAKAKE
ncbi:MAG: YfhO family protein, partial [Oscillospiraceae bacterium]|nr:YfhO family protein [Oscillospiraceae bacterium]